MKSVGSPGFFDNLANVHEYIEMCEGLDGRFLVEVLKKHLKPKSTVLELGMGPGKDLDILGEIYSVTGSDNSQVFLDLYKKYLPRADLLFIDALSLKSERKFDCIYSNKVLHHLTREGLRKSLARQRNLLNDNGILFHTFWKGNKEENFQNLRFIQYEIEQLRRLGERKYMLLDICLYKELIEDDSIYMVLKKI